jgi:hypothetical protein
MAASHYVVKRFVKEILGRTCRDPTNWRSTMTTASSPCHLVIALTAKAVLVLVPTTALAEEPYQRVTVAELKRAIKQQEEEQKRLEATPEYQAKKRAEQAERKRREEEKMETRERELRLKQQAAELERMKLENKRLVNSPATNEGGSPGGSDGVVVPPTVLDVPRATVDPRDFPFFWLGTKGPPNPGVPAPPAPKKAPRIGR